MPNNYIDEVKVDGVINDIHDKRLNTVATVATSGSYNDLSNKPTIPSAVTEATVSGWGFTKNTGTVTTTGTMTSSHVVTSNGGNVIKDSGCEIVDSIGDSSTDSQIPTAKAVADFSGGGKVDWREVSSPLPTNSYVVPVAATAPIGAINMFGGSIPPTGWLMCNGQTVSRTEYFELFSVLGTQFGAGDGSTTFNLPNYNNRFPVGAGDSYDVGDEGGEATHTLTINEMPKHFHRNIHWNDPPNGAKVGLNDSGDAGLRLSYAAAAATSSFTTGFEGNSQAHNNMPPYLAINYIIKAKEVAVVPTMTIVEDVLNSTSHQNALSANMGRELDGKTQEISQELNGKITSVDNKFNYSSTEQIIGTWIDGKTLYRRVFTGTLPAGSNNYRITTDLKLGDVKPKKITGMITTSDNAGSIDIGAYLNNNYYSGVWWTTAGISLYYSSNMASGKYEAIAEYTKTTD